MKIELLYFEGCPSWKTGFENLQIALQNIGFPNSIELIQVSGDEDAKREKFLGSPSFRVDGVDLWEEKRDSYSLSCRVYPTPEGMKGSPTILMLEEVIQNIMSKYSGE